MNVWGTDLLAELALVPATLCRLFEITPIGGDAIRFTDGDQSITVDGQTYSPNNAFQPSAVENAIGGANSNLSLTCLLGVSGFTYLDVIRRRPAGATVKIWIASWGNPSAGKGQIFKGVISGINIVSKLVAVFSCSGGTGLMSKPLTEVYSPSCRADLGDSRCGLDLDTFSATFTVVTADNMVPQIDLTDADGTYNLGKILWLTGANAGQSQEVAISLATGWVNLFYPPRFDIADGDTGTIYRGCAKTVAACTAYNNIANMRAEPFVPGDVAPAS